MAEGGLWVDHTTLSRWVQHSAAECEKRSRPHLKACNDSWRVDETSIKVKKTWMSLSRAVASEGNMLEFLLSATRDAEAAKRFFVTALGRRAGSATQASGSEQNGCPSSCQIGTARQQRGEECGLSQGHGRPHSAWDLACKRRPAAGQVSQYHRPTRSSVHQRAGQASHGLLFPGNGRANLARIRAS